MLKDRDDGVKAVLGPTNTGKTYYAVERMLAYRSGMIGLPLRLLAREVYDKIVALRGPSVVALVTGEERIVPERAAYWVCTVEAMPEGLGCEFLAVDEIQLAADPERGHVFTDRLLYWRGLSETLFMGAGTMRRRIQDLIPRSDYRQQTRFSKLKYTGQKKISRLPTRSAIVGFSVDDVYATAEILRRLKGGAAVVLGALSPRTRNAQVALYQNGDVDYLVATDAIGMGLNLDIAHVAFSGTVKFDGRRSRVLMPHELGQIAGRAGRYRTDGTFGVTGDVAPFEPELAEAIEDSRFQPIKRLQWRNRDLDYGSVEGLLASLSALPEREDFSRSREADDEAVLRQLETSPVLAKRVNNAGDVKRLWSVCQLPDFRKVGPGEHATLVAGIFEHLSVGQRHIPADWMAGQLKRIDKTQGDIDTLSKRLAYVRTWTYVANRGNWLEDTRYWRDETRRVEDRLSDALHDALTQRFVDRRTSVLMRRLKQRESLVAEVTSEGEVRVDGEILGRIEGFRFRPDPKATGAEAKTLKQAAGASLLPEFTKRADKLYNAPDAEFDLTEQGGLMWGNVAVGKLVKGDDVLAPGIEVFVDEEAGGDVAERVKRRLSHWLDRRMAALFEPIFEMKKDAGLEGLSKGVGFRLIEALGVVPRPEIAEDIKSLDQDGRGLLRKHGVRFGQYTIFMPALLKPAPTRLRLVLISLFEGQEEFPSAPPPGLVTIPTVEGANAAYYTRTGYRKAGARAIRIDMVERLADLLRQEDARTGFEAKPEMLSITGLTLEQFADLMRGMGYKADKGEREKVRPPRPDPALADAPKGATSEAPNEDQVPEKADEVSAKPEQTPATEVSAVDDASSVGETGAKEAPTETDAASEKPERADVQADANGQEPTAEAAPEGPEVEVFYTFTRVPRRTGGPRNTDEKSGRRPKQDGRKGKPGSPRKGRGKPKGEPAPRNFSAKPPKKEIDPDNPFAALAALKEK